MKVPINWIKEYTEINTTPKKFSDAMTMSGSKVEGWDILGEEIIKVVSGRVIEITKHPDADKLFVVSVDMGSGIIQVVTGAKNVSEGDCVPVALNGAVLLGGVKITKGKLRGIESEGMLCSLSELKLTINDYPNAIEDGIFILEKGVKPGRDIKELLGLDEVVVEFEITSNRPDCFSVIGLAREAAATFNKGFKVNEPDPEETAEGVLADLISISVEAANLCPRYTARVIEDVVIEPSPEWMRQRLRDCGVRPINNIVDITNYVMLEYGQPMHAFDLEKVSGGSIIVRCAKEGEVLETLDDQPRDLDSSMLVIADDKKPVAVAGVMGGAGSEVTENTKTILFESANFNGTSVRLTAKKLGMRTESSGRFEKGLDINNTVPALNRACELIVELHAGRIVKGIIDICTEIPEKVKIELRVDKINSFLGTDISKERMIEILTMLECEVKGNTVIVPSFRPDLKSEPDLAEEVARFYGYNNIKATMLKGEELTQGEKSYKQKLRDVIENVCLSSGMYEIYTFSFASPGIYDRLNLKETDELRKAVVIRNPLGEDYSIMRTTTLPDMMKVISHNSNRNVEKGAFYEMSYTYHLAAGKELPNQKTVLTLGMYGETGFFEMKGIVEEILDVLGIKGAKYIEENNSVFHPGRCAIIVKDEISIGIIGQIHPGLCAEFEVPEDTLLGSLDVDLLYELTNLERIYRELPKYPAIIRDIALLLNDDVAAGSIMEIIKNNAGINLEKVDFFDVYKGTQTGEGRKSLAFSMTFRSSERTLTEEEVNDSFNKVVEILAKKTGAELR